MLVQEKTQTSNYRLPFSIKRPTYEEAKAIVRGQVFKMTEYKVFRKNNPQFNLPSNPDMYYRTAGWEGAYKFFGTTKISCAVHSRQYWSDVNSGKRTHTIKKRKTTPVTESKQAPTKVTVKSSTTTLQDKQAFIALAKKLGVYDSFRPAFKTLFTYEELLDMVNL
jgi:ribosomal protein S1